MKSHSVGTTPAVYCFLQLLLIADCDFCPLLIATVDRDCLLLIVWGRCWWERRKRGRWLPPGWATTTTTRVWVTFANFGCPEKPKFANSGAGLLVGTLWTFTSRFLFFFISDFGICQKSIEKGDHLDIGKTKRQPTEIIENELRSQKTGLPHKALPSWWQSGRRSGRGAVCQVSSHLAPPLVQPLALVH